MVILAAAPEKVRGAEFANKLSDDERALATSVLAGLLDSRERLRSGEFVATGAMRINDSKLGELRGEVEIYSVFDHDREMMRFDRRQPVRRTLLYDLEGNGMPPGTRNDWKSEDWEARGVFLRDSITGWHSTVPATVQVKPGDDADVKKLVRPFDVRILGLTVGNSIDTGGTFQQCREALDRRTITGVVAESGQIYRLEMAAGKRGLMEYSIWADAEQGFSPVRMEGRWSVAVSSAVRLSEPVSTVSIVWQQKDDTWVPESLSVTDSANTLGIELHYELAFTWMAVNQTPNAELFTAQSLVASHPARVIDTTRGSPVVTEVLNVKKLPPRTTLEKLNVGSSLRWMLIVGNIVAIVVIVGFVLLKRSRYTERK